MGLSSAGVRLAVARWLWGWKPHPTQEEWLLSEAQTKIAACGRRWGKTEAAAVDASTMALTRPGCVQMIVSPTYDQSRLIFDTVERLVMDSPVTRAMAKGIRTPYPRLSIGHSLIMARTADEDGRNLRGHSADRVIVDEAAYVRDSVIQEVISPMLADRNGRLVMLSTPFGKNHFYRAFLRGAGHPPVSPLLKGGLPDTPLLARSEPPETPLLTKEGPEEVEACASFTFPSWTNPHISRDYIERQREEISARQFEVEYEARFMDDVSSVFPWEEINAAVERGAHLVACGPGFGPAACGSGTEATLSSYDYIVAGLDWARYSDYTAIIALGIADGFAEVIAIDRLNGMGWGQQIDRVADFLRLHRVGAALTDQTSIGDALLEQLRAKVWESGMDVSVDGCIFTNQTKREMIDALAMRFAHGTISIPRDERLLKELQYFEREVTDSGNVRMNARSGCHDDLVIALALACRQAKGIGGVGRYLGRNGRVAAGGW